MNRLSLLVLLLCTAAAKNTFAADKSLPENIDGGLRRIISEDGQRVARITPKVTSRGTGRVRRESPSNGIRDAERRMLVVVHLKSGDALANVKAQLENIGAKIAAENAAYRNGAVSAYVPMAKVAEIARLDGVLSVALARRPWRNIGAATTSGLFVMHADALNSQGLKGNGLTIGVLSDSFDMATLDENGDPLMDHASDDVASGDLPGPGNPFGHSMAVNVVEDYTPSPGDPVFDEGRAMLQIVHDIAPNAKLAFATAYPDLVAYANNIRRLRTDALCDVMVDDIIYSEEPFFSDGIVAQAVNDVAFSTVLDGHKVIYFSAAGNQQGGGYTATFNPVADATARAGLPGQNVDLTAVPSTLTSGGFHNFNPDTSGPVDISQTFPIFAQSFVEIDFQWNDPFDKTNGVTTDYNILIFDEDGNYLAQYSGTSNNFSTQEAIEDITIENPTDNDTHFQVVISRAGNSPATPVAQKLRYLAADDFNSGAGATEYYQETAPSTFGRSCAVGAIGVGAYVYDSHPSNPPRPPFTPTLEDSSSSGPSTIDFDSSGNRLAQSEVRQKPDVAAPDGGNTTFFGFDYEGDGLPNFFGTSAAAPHAAAVGALLLQKAGGSDSLTLAQVRTALQSDLTHDVDRFFSRATGQTRGRKKGKRAILSVTGLGNGSNGSSIDPNFFTVRFTPGKNGETLQQVTINLKEAGLKFDTTQATGFPATLGTLVGISPQQISISAPAETVSFSSLTLSFAGGSFNGNTSVSFGVDRDFIGDGAGNLGDLLEGASIRGMTSTGAQINGVFRNLYGSGFTFADGFGLIDAVKAAAHVP
jgi:hypothetical protein